MNNLIYVNLHSTGYLKKYFSSPLILITAIISILFSPSTVSLIVSIGIIILFATARSKTKLFNPDSGLSFLKIASLISTVIVGFVTLSILLLSLYCTFLFTFQHTAERIENTLEKRNLLIILYFVFGKFAGNTLIYLSLSIFSSNTQKTIASPYLNKKGTTLFIIGAALSLIISILLPLYTYFVYKELFHALVLAFFYLFYNCTNSEILIFEFIFAVASSVFLSVPPVFMLINGIRYRRFANKANADVPETIPYNASVKYCSACGTRQACNNQYCSNCGKRL